VLYQGRSYKVYRGMGSLGAMRAGSKDRYFQGASTIASSCPRASRAASRTAARSPRPPPAVGGVRSGMGYVGAATIAELQTRARFRRISSAGLRESHVHDVIITQEAPNYRLE
jgi:IMP dehydrogenase